MKRYNLDQIKAGLPEYLRKIGTRIFRETEDVIIAACPIHGGSKANFHAKRDSSGVWLWICRSGCGGLGGSALDLHAALHGLSAHSLDCIAGVAEVLGISPDDSPLPLASRVEMLARKKRLQDEARAGEKARKLSEAIREKRDALLSPYFSDEWGANLWHASPHLIEADSLSQIRQLLAGLFSSEAILWMGGMKDTGKERHRWNFRPCRDWLEVEAPPSRLAAGVFRPGIISRSESSLAERPFLVIESDELIGRKPETAEEREQNKALSAALFRFMEEKLGMTLRAVIDTGGKSLHGWFDRPPPDGVEALATLLDGLAIDSAVFHRGSSNPLRAPGCLHEGTRQRAQLFYLNPISQP